jgi:hypothetical protein
LFRACQAIIAARISVGGKDIVEIGSQQELGWSSARSHIAHRGGSPDFARIET